MVSFHHLPINAPPWKTALPNRRRFVLKHGIPVVLCLEKAAHKGLDYGKDQLEPPDTHPRIVQVVDRKALFMVLGVPMGHEIRR